jgi:hypothetical protein
MAEACEFAVYAPIAPRRVLGRHLHHEPANLHSGGWSSRWTRRGVGPAARNATTMPSQQRVGSDHPSMTAGPWQCLRDRAEQRPILIGH